MNVPATALVGYRGACFHLLPRQDPSMANMVILLSRWRTEGQPSESKAAEVSSDPLALNLRPS